MTGDTSDVMLTWEFWQGSTVETEKFHPVEQIQQFVALVPMYLTRNVCNTLETQKSDAEFIYHLINSFIVKSN